MIWNRTTAPEDKKKGRSIYPTHARIQHLAMGRQILQQKKKSVGNLISELLPPTKKKEGFLLCDIDFTVSVWVVEPRSAVGGCNNEPPGPEISHKQKNGIYLFAVQPRQMHTSLKNEGELDTEKLQTGDGAM